MFLFAGVCIALGVMGVCALAACGYRFGTDDQAQYLVQLIALQNPDVFAGDVYLRAFGAIGSVFWRPIALVVREPFLAESVLAISVLIAAANGWLLWRIGRTAIGARARGAVGAAMCVPLLFVVPKEQNWFGLVSLGDVELTATFGVMPLVFGSILLWMRGRVLWCAALAFSAVAVHAQTGAALLAAWWCALGARWLLDRKHGVVLIGAAAAGATGLCAAWLSMRMPGDVATRIGEQGRMMYAELVNPLDAPVRSWASMMSVLLLGCAAAARLWRDERRSRRMDSPAGQLILWAGASLVFPCAALVLHAAGVNDPLLWRLMTGRAFMLAQIGAIVMVGIWCAREIQRDRGMRAAASATLCAVAAWPFPEFGDAGAAAGLVGVFMLICGAKERGAAMSPRRGASWLAMAPGCAVVVMVAAAGAIERSFSWIERAEESSWIEAQEWARANTHVGARFVTPPYLTGWRIGSHRSTVGELRDGGLLFYSDDDVLVWRARMDALGMPPNAGFAVTEDEGKALRDEFAGAIEREISSIVRDTGAAFIVCEREADVATGECVWSNERFCIRRISTREQRAAADWR